MARLLKGIAPEFERVEKLGFNVAWETRFQMQDEAFKAIEERTTVVKQQVADSYAFYEVVKRQPLQIRWIPFMDMHEAHPAWIRGLNLQDVLDQEQWENAFRKLGA